MPWHDEPPWTAKKRMTEVVEKIGRVIDAYRTGDLHYRQALTEIDELRNGAGGPVARIGETHRPEVQSDADV